MKTLFCPVKVAIGFVLGLKCVGNVLEIGVYLGIYTVKGLIQDIMQSKDYLCDLKVFVFIKLYVFIASEYHSAMFYTNLSLSGLRFNYSDYKIICYTYQKF